MPAELLRSQTQALEPLGEDERGVVVDVTAGLDEVVTVVSGGARHRGTAGLSQGEDPSGRRCPDLSP